jgi:hypothetical protein
MSLAYSVLAAPFLPNIIVTKSLALHKLYIFTGQLVASFGVDVLANCQMSNVKPYRGHHFLKI